MIRKVKKEEDNLILIRKRISEELDQYIEFKKLDKHKAKFTETYAYEKNKWKNDKKYDLNDEDCPDEAVRYLEKRGMEVVNHG